MHGYYGFIHLYTASTVFICIINPAASAGDMGLIPGLYLYNKYLANTSYVEIQQTGKSDTVCLAFLLLRPKWRDGGSNKVKAAKLILSQGKTKS